MIMPECQKCGILFPSRIKIDGKTRNLQRRRFCINCVPFEPKNRDLIPSEPLQPSEDLAYLIGVISGDGCLSRVSRTYKLLIACDIRYPDLIDKYVDLVSRLIGSKVSINWRKDCKCADVYTYSNKLPILLDLPVGTKTKNGYAVP